MSGKIKVLIVDDSALVRRAISDALALDPEIEVVGTANDPLVAQEKMPKLQPDVITLDMEMPRMDGLTFLKILAQQKPMIPVVVVSSLTQQGSAMALAAMDAGARDVLAKPDGSMSIGSLAHKLAFHVKAAARARRTPVSFAPATPTAHAGSPGLASPLKPATPAPAAPTPLRGSSGPSAAPAPAPRGVPPGAAGRSASPGAVDTGGSDRRLIVIGSSTGGVEALRYVLPSLPAQLPPIAVAQHIPPFFSKAVATRINELCGYEVREAGDNEDLHPGLCVIAPGDFHLTIVKTLLGYKTRLTKTPPVHYCRPAVDVLFRSAAEAAGSRLVAALLTGMGSDGALGMQAIKAVGGTTIAEHEDTCVVYGMPRAAVQLGVVDKILPLDQIPAGIVRAVGAIAG
jgi:two-component system chemotaxis response regulator CheB